MTAAKKSTVKVAPPDVASSDAKFGGKIPVTKKLATASLAKTPSKTTPKTPGNKNPARKTGSKNAAANQQLSRSSASGKAVNTGDVVKTARLEKPKKTKMVRDSFTIPKAEYAVLDDLKQRAVKLTHPTKKVSYCAPVSRLWLRYQTPPF